MRRSRAGLALAGALVALSLLGCGKSGAAPATFSPGAGGAGGAPAGGGGVAGLSSCLDRPDGLPAPPSGGLPCELIPPGLR